jgi:hypothetical protein
MVTNERAGLLHGRQERAAVLGWDGQILWFAAIRVVNGRDHGFLRLGRKHVMNACTARVVVVLYFYFQRFKALFDLRCKLAHVFVRRGNLSQPLGVQLPYLRKPVVDILCDELLEALDLLQRRLHLPFKLRDQLDRVHRREAALASSLKLRAERGELLDGRDLRQHVAHALKFGRVRVERGAKLLQLVVQGEVAIEPPSTFGR